MHLKSVEITNYKCFSTPTKIGLDPSMTVIVGRNNVGKSALLQCLSLTIGNHPHRSEGTMPNMGDRPAARSKLVAEILATGADVESILRSRAGPLHIVSPDSHPGGKAGGGQLLESFVSPNSTSTLTATKWGDQGPLAFEGTDYLGHYPCPPSNVAGKYERYMPQGHQTLPVWEASSSSTSTDHDLRRVLSTAFSDGVYAFRAERLKVGVCAMGTSNQLAPDAANLPEVLNALQGNPERMRRFNEAVHRVLPQVTKVTVRPLPSGGAKVEVLVWSGPLDSERDDLAIPLLESGTGVSQVLAMLYVVLTADSPKTILIDEPSSFLHPGGVAALLDVFREHKRHQYVIATHSPGVIAGASPNKIYILENEANTASIHEVDPKVVEDQRRVLDAVGTRLSDVFGPTQILWVEGRTEEKCFPEIVARDLPSGTAILGVVNTGDFQRKHVRTVTEIYDRLSKGVGLIPPACGFLFDREGLTEEKRQRLQDSCGEKLQFLPRRMYENYLLDAEAVASVLNASDHLTESPFQAARVRVWIENHRLEHDGSGDEGSWRQNVDGARLLSALFDDLTNNAESYDKVFHGLALTKWLLEHEPDALSEVAKLLAQLLAEGIPEAAD